MTILLTLLIASAHADDWEFDLRGQTLIGLGMKDVTGPLDLLPPDTPWQPEAGVGGSISRELRPRLRLEGQVNVGYILDGGIYTAVRPALRLYVDDRDETGALSFIGGAGMRIANGVGPDFVLGAALDLRGIPPWMAPRMQALASLGLPGQPAVLDLSLGIFFPSPHDAPELVIDDPIPPEIPKVTVFKPVEAMVWIPHPICRWAPADAAHDLLADTLQQVAELPDLEVKADGFNHIYVGHDLSDEHRISDKDVTLEPHPPTGGVVVFSHPGDELIVGKQKVPMSDEGVAVLNVPARKIEVTVFGGGREEKRVIQVEDDQAVWLEFAPAPPLYVAFEEGSFALNPDGAEVIRGIARRPGSYVYEIKSTRPGGDKGKAAKLAERRTKAVAEQLKALGLPKTAIRVVRHSQRLGDTVEITPVGGDQ
jgi:hypothetical protein